MKLLLQAGIHLIKKVITFVIYGRSVQVSKACTLFYFFSAEFFFSQIFLREKGFVPQISQIYTDFLHHDFILFIWSFHYLIIPFLYKTKMISLAKVTKTRDFVFSS